MASYTPTAKVAAGGIAGALTVLLAFVGTLLGLDLPEPVTAAITVLLTFGASYLKSDDPAGDHAADA